MDQRLTEIIAWIRRSTDVDAGRGALVPVSGGSDSALCFWLCAQALPPERVAAAFVGTKLRCREWFEQLGLVKSIEREMPEKHIEVHRWALMLAESLDFRGWLVGTRNRTEEILGTYSLASRTATCLPLAGLWKSEVMELARSVGVPDEILESSNQADPSCGRPQELAEIPFCVVDRFLQVRIGDRPNSDLECVSRQVIDYLDAIYRRNRFKRLLPMRPDDNRNRVHPN